MQDVSFLKRARHLTARFAGYLVARPLNDSELDEVAQVLGPELNSLFAMLQYQDQRHSYDVFVRVGCEPHLAQAALLHDVGKAESRLGSVARACATVLRALRAPVPRRWEMYLDHGPIGARMLRQAGADDLAVSFTAGHPGDPPQDVTPRDWDALAAADEGLRSPRS
jgi:hypothetical protein